MAAAAASAFFPLPFLPLPFFLPDLPTTCFSDLSSALIEAFLLIALLYFFLAFFFAFFEAFLFLSAFGTFGTVPWQTTAVSPTGFVSSAVNSGRSLRHRSAHAHPVDLLGIRAPASTRRARCGRTRLGADTSNAPKMATNSRPRLDFKMGSSPWTVASLDRSSKSEISGPL